MFESQFCKHIQILAARPRLITMIIDVCLFVCYCKKRHNIFEFIVCCKYFRPQARFKHWQKIKEKSTKFKIRDKTFTFSKISPLVQLGWRMVHGRNRQSTAHKWMNKRRLDENYFHFLANNLLRLICSKANQKKCQETSILQPPPGSSNLVITSLLPPAGLQDGVGHKDERFVSRYIANAIYCIIWKYRDIAIFRKYRDILTIFVMYDFGHFLAWNRPESNCNSSI